MVNVPLGNGTPRTASDWAPDEVGPWPVRAFRSTRVRVVTIALAVLLIAGTAYSRLVVLPELSNDRYELWVAGSENDLRIDVDLENSLVYVTGASSLPNLVVTGNQVYLPAGDIFPGNSSDADWVSTPLDGLDPRFQSLTADRIAPALARRVKQCAPPSADAVQVIELLLPSASPRADGVSICERGAGLAADTGQDVFVSVSAVRPGPTADLALESSVSYLDTDNPDAVLQSLDPAPAP